MTTFSKKIFIRKYKAYFIPAATAFVIVFMSLLILKPKISAIILTQKNLEKNLILLEALTKKANALASLDQNNLKEMFNMVNTAVPSDKDVPSFMLAVGRIGNEASVSVGLIEVNAGNISTTSASVDPKKQNQPLNAKVTIKGTFQNIVSFISKIARGRRLLKISGLNLSGTGAQKANEAINMTLSILLYYQPLPETLGEISSPVVDITDEEQKNYLAIRNYTYYSYIGDANLDQVVQPVQVNSVPVGKADLFNR